jgi:hypothetical protein
MKPVPGGVQSSLLTRELRQQIYFFRHFEVWTGKIYRYVDVCIDILLPVYSLYNLIFSLPITKGFGN